jgi:hypothetical protein
LPTTTFYIGLALFILSFFLPAIRNANLSDRGVSGWLCAMMAFFGLNNEEVNGLAFSGDLLTRLRLPTSYYGSSIEHGTGDSSWQLPS